MTQPEALRLADLMANLKFSVKGADNATAMEEAAAELRRIHAESEFMVELVKNLVGQRDALLEALKPFVTIGSGFDMDDIRRARAAIKQAEGEKA